MTKKNIFGTKVRILDEGGRPIFKAKGRKDKVKKELMNFMRDKY